VTSTTSPRVLILYSNPGDSQRLRLDREHRAIDAVLREMGLDSSVILRRHAVSVEDIQFSGHGSEEGILLERQPTGKQELVDAGRLTAALSGVSPKTRAFLFLSCFSSASLAELAMAAPFVITVSGSAADEACIQFVASFYRSYMAEGSIESAFREAGIEIDFRGFGSNLHTVLTRRALLRGESATLYATSVQGDTLYVDVSPVEVQIQALGVKRERFLSALCRKIRLHRRIFDRPSERALLSLGEYFAEFSWQSADDAITCQRLLRLREGMVPAVCNLWSDLLLSYNELSAARYRSMPSPADPQSEPWLKAALKELDGELDYYFAREGAELLRQEIPQPFQMAQALALANARHAEMAFARGDFPQTVFYLECALTAVHDLVNTLTDRLTEPAMP
jgi:hypothetical protein